MCRIEAWAIGVTPDHVEIYRIEPGIHKMGDLATDAGLNFEDLDFSSLAFTAIKRISVPIAEKEKGKI